MMLRAQLEQASHGVVAPHGAGCGRGGC
jgi:hypothetical protein